MQVIDQIDQMNRILIGLFVSHSDLLLSQCLSVCACSLRRFTASEGLDMQIHKYVHHQLHHHTDQWKIKGFYLSLDAVWSLQTETHRSLSFFDEVGTNCKAVLNDSSSGAKISTG